MPERNLLIGPWYFKSLIGHQGTVPDANAARFFMKNLMNIAAADGTLSDRQREWIIGFALACGNSDDLINELRTYQPGTDTQIFQTLVTDRDKPHVKMTRRSMVYNAIRAAGADGELNEKKLQAIYGLAKNLDVTPEQVRQVQDLYEEEEEMRKKRIKILFPQGFESLVNAFKKEN